MIATPSIAIVILNYNGLDFLKKFLPQVIAQSSPAKIVVADNFSTDESVHYIQTHFKTISLIQNGRNAGYTGGYNWALKQIEADYYVLLNSDVEVTPHWLNPIIQLMEQHPQIAACQPKLLDYEKKTLFEYAGGSGGYIDTYGYPFCRGRVFDTLEKDIGQYDTTQEIAWASGACLFVRSKLFHEVGGFDERYFAHMEEIDLCWRLKNKGFQIMAVPQSCVYHVGGGTLNKINPRKTFLNFRNNLSTLTKNHSSRFWIGIVLCRLVLDGVAGLKFLANGQVTHFWQILRAHFAYYAWLPYLLKQRRVLKQGQTKINTLGFYKGNIVVAYFLKGKKTFSEIVKSNG